MVKGNKLGATTTTTIELLGTRSRPTANLASFRCLQLFYYVCCVHHAALYAYRLVTIQHAHHHPSTYIKIYIENCGLHTPVRCHRAERIFSFIPLFCAMQIKLEQECAGAKFLKQNYVYILQQTRLQPMLLKYSRKKSRVGAERVTVSAVIGKPRNNCCIVQKKKKN